MIAQNLSIFVYIESSSANNITTTAFGNVTCKPGSVGTPENCEVYCQEQHCNGATITCPLFGDCFILCNTAAGCRNAIINATQQNGNFELECNDPTPISGSQDDNICYGIDVLGSTISPAEQTGTSFLVTCGLDRNACRQAIINCAQGMDCEIDCHQKDDYPGSDGAIRTCRDSVITGPTDYSLRVECEENNACQGMNLHAEDSSYLNITCADTNSCCDMDIYCPVNEYQNKACEIEGM